MSGPQLYWRRSHRGHQVFTPGRLYRVSRSGGIDEFITADAGKHVLTRTYKINDIVSKEYFTEVWLLPDGTELPATE